MLPDGHRLHVVLDGNLRCALVAHRLAARFPWVRDYALYSQRHCRHRAGMVGHAGGGPHFAGFSARGRTRLGVRASRGAVVVVGRISIRGWRAVAAGAVATLVVGTGLAAAATPVGVGLGAVSTRVPVDRSGQQANGESLEPAISADGRFVTFTSGASNLVPGDTSSSLDVFVRDRMAQVPRRVSVGPGGQEANSISLDPAISADGRFVTFVSHASNLVPGDTNNDIDVFVRDRVAQLTRRVSVGPGGHQGNDHSLEPAISGHGRFVAFTSRASNLVPGDTNNDFDVFVRDRVAQLTRRVGPGGRQAAISGHGRYVAFTSGVALVAKRTHGREDVFFLDRTLHVTRRVSVGSGGQQANDISFEPAISADGRFVAFRSPASNLVAGDTNGIDDVFVRDRRLHVTQRVSVGSGGHQANSGSFFAAISAHGRYVTFTSAATNLVAGDTNRRLDVFVRDRTAQLTRRVSVGPGGQQANNRSSDAAISAHCRFVTFASDASNLVPGDTNNTGDVFVRDRTAQLTRRVSVG
jgi:Tol biopolymer transport system component